MNDLLQRLEANCLKSLMSSFGTYPDTAAIKATMREAAARIRELEAQLAEDRETIADLRALIKARADSEGVAISLIEDAIALGVRAGRAATTANDPRVAALVEALELFTWSYLHESDKIVDAFYRAESALAAIKGGADDRQTS